MSRPTSERNLAAAAEAVYLALGRKPPLVLAVAVDCLEAAGEEAVKAALADAVRECRRRHGREDDATIAYLTARAVSMGRASGGGAPRKGEAPDEPGTEGLAAGEADAVKADTRGGEEAGLGRDDAHGPDADEGVEEAEEAEVAKGGGKARQGAPRKTTGGRGPRRT